MLLFQSSLNFVNFRGVYVKVRGVFAKSLNCELANPLSFKVFPLGLSRIPRVIDELFEEEKKQEKRTLDLYINGFFSMMMNVPTPIICRMFF